MGDEGQQNSAEANERGEIGRGFLGLMLATRGTRGGDILHTCCSGVQQRWDVFTNRNSGIIGWGGGGDAYGFHRGTAVSGGVGKFYKLCRDRDTTECGGLEKRLLRNITQRNFG